MMVHMAEKSITVLVVDDDALIRRSLRAGYELAGFGVQEAMCGREALRFAALSTPDLVILDLGLPDIDGTEVLRDLRAWSNVPLIVLSARSGEDDKVVSLEIGADDYVVKPFGMPELLARSRAAIRRHSRADNGEAIVKAGALTIDLDSRRVSMGGKDVKLTQKEFRVLQALARRPGMVVTHHQILEKVWGPSHVNDTHYLRILMRRLRQKIEIDPMTPCVLVTELGTGYRLVQPACEQSDDAPKTSVCLIPETSATAPMPGRVAAGVPQRNLLLASWRSDVDD
jgi:two-component system, OmpR family, KDP operon response regulator KdpE